MTRFLILYRADDSTAEQTASIDPEAGAESMSAWMDWAAHAGDAIVDLGMPTQTVAGGSLGSHIGGYSIMQSESLASLLALFEEHPHRASGGDIEVLEMQPIPGL